MENNTNFVILKQGAEGRIYKGSYLQKSAIVKERFVKKYRHSDLDGAITKERIRAEVRAILRCKEAGILTPALYLVDLHRRRIYMEEIENSETAKDYMNRLKKMNESDVIREKLDNLANDIGTVLSKMHANSVIHGDLTTSNILVKCNKIYLIDFGLSHFSSTAEDKAVDLYVLERALFSTHENSQQLLDTILQAYQRNNKKSKDIIVKLNEVRARGRKRSMVG